MLYHIGFFSSCEREGEVRESSCLAKQSSHVPIFKSTAQRLHVCTNYRYHAAHI
jgi:hypothetical protein